MKNKFFAVFILLISILCLMSVAACEKIVDIPYDLQESSDTDLKNSVTLYDDAILWMKDEYIFANRTSPLPDAEDCPSEITNIIDSKEKFDEAFDEFPVEINFDEQILVLYFFASDNIFAQCGKRLRYYELTDVTREGAKINFGICLNKTALLIPNEQYLDTTIPTHLCLTFLMPKMQVNNFEFNLAYKKYYIEWKGDINDNATIYNGDINWLREEYGKNISFAIESQNSLIDKIQNHEEYITAFKKFYNTFDVNDEMLVLYLIKEDVNDAYAYEYSIADIQYGEGFLDISLNKKVKESQSKDGSNNMTFLVIRLPQLPAYNIKININE